MTRIKPHSIAVTTLGIVVLLLAASMAPARASAEDRPFLSENYEIDVEPFVDEDLSAFCGTDIYVEPSGKGHVKLFDDGSVVDHFNVRTTIWNPASDEVVIRQEAATYRGQSEETLDELTQTLTVVYSDSFVGLPSKFYKPGTGVISRDAGQVTFSAKFVLDVSGPGEPELISFEETLDFRGPHPEITGDVAELAGTLCDALGA